MILHRAKDYYENDKKKGFKKQARDKYRNLSKEEKDTISYGKKRYNMSEEKKRKTKRISKKLS